MDLSKVPTCELVRELAKREGVEQLTVEPYAAYEIVIGEQKQADTGPAVILKVID